MHLLSPQCNGDLESVFLARMGFFTIFVLNVETEEEDEEDDRVHSPHPISSLWSAQSKWPSHLQSTGMHLVRSHWKPLVHTVQETAKWCLLRIDIISRSEYHSMMNIIAFMEQEKSYEIGTELERYRLRFWRRNMGASSDYFYRKLRIQLRSLLINVP